LTNDHYKSDQHTDVLIDVFRVQSPKAQAFHHSFPHSPIMIDFLHITRMQN